MTVATFSCISPEAAAFSTLLTAGPWFLMLEVLAKAKVMRKRSQSGAWSRDVKGYIEYPTVNCHGMDPSTRRPCRMKGPHVLDYIAIYVGRPPKAHLRLQLTGKIHKTRLRSLPNSKGHHSTFVGYARVSHISRNSQILVDPQLDASIQRVSQNSREKS